MKFRLPGFIEKAMNRHSKSEETNPADSNGSQPKEQNYRILLDGKEYGKIQAKSKYDAMMAIHKKMKIPYGTNEKSYSIEAFPVKEKLPKEPVFRIMVCDTGEILSFWDREVWVGKGRIANLIPVNNRSVQFVHMKIWMDENGKLYAMDIASTYGSFYSEKRTKLFYTVELGKERIIWASNAKMKILKPK